MLLSEKNKIQHNVYNMMSLSSDTIFMKHKQCYMVPDIYRCVKVFKDIWKDTGQTNRIGGILRGLRRTGEARKSGGGLKGTFISSAVLYIFKRRK